MTLTIFAALLLPPSFASFFLSFMPIFPYSGHGKGEVQPSYLPLGSQDPRRGFAFLLSPILCCNSPGRHSHFWHPRQPAEPSWAPINSRSPIFFPQVSPKPHLSHSGFCSWFSELHYKISHAHFVNAISAHPSRLGILGKGLMIPLWRGSSSPPNFMSSTDALGRLPWGFHPAAHLFHSFLHSCTKLGLRSYCVPSLVLGTRDPAVTRQMWKLWPE